MKAFHTYITRKDDFTFCYYDKDHLGNIRQVTELDGTSKGDVIQKNNYYPFGAEFCDNWAKSYIQRHKYNGKEFDNMHGLNTYDYGARQYNPVTARWDRVDPLAHEYYGVSPYVYCANNPVMLVDPDGRKWEDPTAAQELKDDISKRISSLQKEISDLQDKLSMDGVSEENVNKQIRELDYMVSHLTQSMQDIDLLADDEKNTYAFRQTNGGRHHVQKGDDGIVYIETSSKAMSIHEITHIRQDLVKGGLKFEGDLLTYYDKTVNIKFSSEVEAYRKQYSFDGSFPGNTEGLGIIGINGNSVAAIRDENGELVYNFK